MYPTNKHSQVPTSTYRVAGSTGLNTQEANWRDYRTVYHTEQGRKPPRGSFLGQIPRGAAPEKSAAAEKEAEKRHILEASPKERVHVKATAEEEKPTKESSKSSVSASKTKIYTVTGTNVYTGTTITHRCNLSRFPPETRARMKYSDQLSRCRQCAVHPNASPEAKIYQTLRGVGLSEERAVEMVSKMLNAAQETAAALLQAPVDSEWVKKQ